MMTTKSDSQSPPIFKDYHMTSNSPSKRSVLTTMELEDFMKPILSRGYLLKIDLTNASLEILLNSESKSLTIATTS